jgi:hypothetical protein
MFILQYVTKNKSNTNLNLKLLDKCENHLEETIVKYFCKSCNMSICLNCILSCHINHLYNNSEVSEEDNDISIFDYPEIYDLKNTQTTSLSDSFIDKVDISIFNSEKAEINHANDKNKYL